ncbi:MAG: hypothetical protein OXQ29_17565 [Rhodospirillaceae bacterium]|nr:hypothetical protein [Rhodospirillaceae bacterium]
MGIRTVRLDDDAEAVLSDLRRRTGLSISDVFKRGLQAYASASRDAEIKMPYEIYRKLDLGPGGYAVAPAREAKAHIARTIAAKHKK